MRKHRSYPVEFKRQVAQEYLAGEKIPRRLTGIALAASDLRYGQPDRPRWKGNGAAPT